MGVRRDLGKIWNEMGKNLEMDDIKGLRAQFLNQVRQGKGMKEGFKKEQGKRRICIQKATLEKCFGKTTKWKNEQRNTFGRPALIRSYGKTTRKRD